MQSLPLNPRPYFIDEKAFSTPFLYPRRGNKNETKTLNSWMSRRRLVGMYQLCTQTWQLHILSKYPNNTPDTVILIKSSKKHNSLPPFHAPWRNSHQWARAFYIIEASQSDTDTPHTVGLLWTSEQPVAETSTRQHTILKTDGHPVSQLDSNPQSQEASSCKPTPWTARPLGTA